MNALRKLFDNEDPCSLAHRFRKNRFNLLLSILNKLHKPVKILDIGGTSVFWQMMDVELLDDCELHLVNIQPDLHKRCSTNSDFCRFSSFIGDGRDLSCFDDQTFDLVFSNSVIEHVGCYEEQLKFANETKRVGRLFFVQTPNKYFPIEPHYHFPFFQFFSVETKAYMHKRFALGWAEKAETDELAMMQARSVNLLSKKELRKLFPGSLIIEEKFLFFTKSLISTNCQNYLA